jgi:16S rRNA (guanine527-N7)-methyltransferase
MPTRPPLAIPPHEPQPAPSNVLRHLEEDLGLPSAAAAQLGDFLGRLLAMNQKMNLISRVDPSNAWDRHIVDSLTLLPLLADVPAGGRLIDVGSGGGLPGIPLAIARPDLQVTLLDATQKKTRFLGDVAKTMSLDNVAVVTGRAETLCGERDFNGHFDVVTARAVCRLEALLKLTAPFAKRGGRLLLTKGQKADEELVEAKRSLGKLGLTFNRIAATPSGRIVVFDKTG